MLTRQTVSHAYTPHPVMHAVAPGAVRATLVKGITQTWAISRPVSAPYVGMNPPINIVENQRHYGPLNRAGSITLAPRYPKLEADLTNPNTWQRPYRFSNL